MTHAAPHSKRCRRLATLLFYATFLALSAAWNAWRTAGADWLPAWGQIVPGAIAAVLFHVCFRPGPGDSTWPGQPIVQVNAQRTCRGAHSLRRFHVFA